MLVAKKKKRKRKREKREKRETIKRTVIFHFSPQLSIHQPERKISNQDKVKWKYSDRQCKLSHFIQQKI